jgi:MerR family redox-sensitive transcriptional activator SoxR
MAQLTISQVARQVRLQSSAIRYYEQIGLLPPAQRMSGQRRYDTTVLYRLAIIQQARQLGFTLDEIRELFFGFCNVPRASERWQKLSQRKLKELDGLMDGIRTLQRLLKKMMQNCRCETLDQCGKAIFQSGMR